MQQIIMNGNSAAAYGAMLSRIQVTSAYPISPQTGIVETLAELVASGKLNARYIESESEHSAMVSIIAAAETGARVFTATSAQGLALMHEMLHWAAGARLPIVMVNVSRAMGLPQTMYCDHSDVLSQRDTGWMVVFCEQNQEVVDMIIQGYKIAEQVMLPIIVNMDGFYNSYTTEPITLDDQDELDRYLPPYKPPFKLDPDDPLTFYGGTQPGTYMEFRYQMYEAMQQALQTAQAADDEFGKRFGRRYGLLEAYQCEDAELVLVAAGSMAGTIREVVDDRRALGEKIGLLKIRFLRPFPTKEVRRALANVNKVAVIDRNMSVGLGGILCNEIRAALQPEHDQKTVLSFIAGLGGRDVTPDSIRQVIELAHTNMGQDQPIWIDLKE